jgi:hypothetical protein
VLRYRCTKCGKTFSEPQPLQGVRIETAQVVQVVSLLCEGNSIRGICRLVSLHLETVLNIVETIGAACFQFHDRKVRKVKAESVQTDELYSFVRCKQEHNSTGNAEWGEQYTFLTVIRESKLVLSFLTGKRTRENAHQHLNDVRGRLDGRTQISTDNFLPYRGRTGAVQTVFGHDGIDYGMLTKVFANSPLPEKRYSPPVCILCKKTPMLGNPDRNLISTSHAERQNLNVRLFTKRFARLTLCYSKKLANLRHAVALFVCYWNFCWLHHTLGQTPAQAAGLADRKWTVAELVEAVSKQEPITN